jgi:hypothetical protein
MREQWPSGHGKKRAKFTPLGFNPGSKQNSARKRMLDRRVFILFCSGKTQRQLKKNKPISAFFARFQRAPDYRRRVPQVPPLGPAKARPPPSEHGRVLSQGTSLLVPQKTPKKENAGFSPPRDQSLPAPESPMRYARPQDAPLRDAANRFGRLSTEAPKAGKRRAQQISRFNPRRRRRPARFPKHLKTTGVSRMMSHQHQQTPRLFCSFQE